MKIGEIKKEALLLIFPEIEVRFDAQNDNSINEAMNALKCDPSIRSYLDSAVPAINRALCEIENAGATKTKRAAVTVKNTKNATNLKEKIPDLLSVLSIRQDGREIKYSEVDSYVLLLGADCGEIEVVYKSSVEKVRYVTEESYEPELDFGVASLIPYFVASELCMHEDSERARELRQRFYDGLGVYRGKSATQGEVEAVYSW